MAQPWADLEADDFTHPYHREIFELVQKLGGPGRVGARGLLEAASDDAVRTLVSALSVEPLPVATEPDQRFAAAYVVRLRRLTAMRRISELKSRLQRMNPVTHATQYNRLFGELIALESHHRSLLETAIGND
jgi:DNA primase